MLWTEREDGEAVLVQVEVEGGGPVDDETDFLSVNLGSEDGQTDCSSSLQN